jgi:hypothetical protein
VIHLSAMVMIANPLVKMMDNALMRILIYQHALVAPANNVEKVEKE